MLGVGASGPRWPCIRICCVRRTGRHRHRHGVVHGMPHGMVHLLHIGRLWCRRLHVQVMPCMRNRHLNGNCHRMRKRPADQRGDHHQEHRQACPCVQPAVEDKSVQGSDSTGSKTDVRSRMFCAKHLQPFLAWLAGLPRFLLMADAWPSIRSQDKARRQIKVMPGTAVCSGQQASRCRASKRHCAAGAQLADALMGTRRRGHQTKNAMKNFALCVLVLSALRLAACQRSHTPVLTRHHLRGRPRPRPRLLLRQLWRKMLGRAQRRSASRSQAAISPCATPPLHRTASSTG